MKNLMESAFASSSLSGNKISDKDYVHIVCIIFISTSTFLGNFMIRINALYW